MTTIYRASAVAVVGALALAGGASAASARVWAEPFALGHGANRAQYPTASDPIATAADGHGDIVAAWDGPRAHGRQTIEVTTRGAHHQLSGARVGYRVNGTVSDPVVAIDARGDAVVLFTHFAPRTRVGRVLALSVHAGRRPGQAKPVSPAGVPAEEPAVAMSGRGAATIVFQRDQPYTTPPAGAPLGSVGLPDVVMATARPEAGRGFGAPSVISAPAQDVASGRAGAFHPTVTMSASGTATAAWYRNVGETGSPATETGRLETAVAATGGSFRRPVQTGTASAGAQPVLAGDAAGDLVMAWNDAGGSLVAAGAPAGGTFGPPTTLVATPGQRPPVIAFGPGRTALLAFVNPGGGANNDGSLQTASWSPGRAVTPVQTVPALNGAYAGPDEPAIVFWHGRPVVTWQELGGFQDPETGNHANIGLEYATAVTPTRLGHGQLLRARRFAGKGVYAAFAATTLAGGGTGPVYALWQLSGGGVQARRLLRPAPVHAASRRGTAAP